MVGPRCSSVVRAHGAMGRRIDPSWWSEMSLMVRWVVGSILHGGSKMLLCGKNVRSWCDGSSDRTFMVGARCRSVVRAFAHGAMGRRIDPSWWEQDVVPW